MKNNLTRENLIKCLVIGLCAILTGCGTIGLAQDATFESAYSGVPEEPLNIYTAQSSGVLEEVNTEAETITVYRLKEKDEMTLAYDKATTVSDKYGSMLVMEQLSPGEIVTVAYNGEAGKAGQVQIAQDTWNYEGISRHEINEGKGTLQTGSDTYRITGDTKVFSGREQISMDQILKEDEISLRGSGYDIASIVVEKGHGYLRLENEEALVGGWIEIGQTVIQQIDENMLFTVPEGYYTVRLSADKMKETREVLVERNKEAVLDLGDIEVPQPVNGRVLFSVYPAEAAVFVDGVNIDPSYAVRMSFGLHQITAAADGYNTISEYFDVEGETTTVRLSLDIAKEDSTVSGNSVVKNSYHTITVKTPEGTEVYEDNLYMGQAPVTYEKKAGSHTITLRKTGYVTKSYQIEVPDDDRDLVYTFPELISESTVSGNSISPSPSPSPSPKKTVSGNTAKKSDNKEDDEDDDRVIRGELDTVSANVLK